MIGKLWMTAWRVCVTSWSATRASTTATPTRIQSPTTITCGFYAFLEVRLKTDAKTAGTESSLPDLHEIGGRAIELVARLQVERVVERVDVGQRHERAIHPGRVGVGQQLIAQRLVARFEPPHLRVAEEEALIAAEAADN